MANGEREAPAQRKRKGHGQERDDDPGLRGLVELRVLPQQLEASRRARHGAAALNATANDRVAAAGWRRTAPRIALHVRSRARPYPRTPLRLRRGAIGSRRRMDIGRPQRDSRQSRTGALRPTTSRHRAQVGRRTRRNVLMPAIEIHGLSKRFGDVTAVDEPQLRRPRGSRHRIPRPERRRQDDDPADAARPGRADRRQRHHRRAALRRARRRRRATSARCSSRPASIRAGAHATTCACWPPQAGLPRDPRRRGARRRSASPTPATGASRASRSACASASAWPARCSAGRGC